MRIDQALVARKLCESRQEAQELIAQGKVEVEGVVVLKQTKQVEDNDVIEVKGRRRFVSRGGEKLEGIFLDIFTDEKGVQAFCAGKRALDIGSSTGGFTDFLLQHGVVHVDAVDVGTLQLHPSLRNDTRVSLFENTDIRLFKTDHTYDIVVVDLSFISLQDVLQYILSSGHSGSRYFLLIKPQFEVGQGNTKKGIVKDSKLVEDILMRYEKLLENGGLKNIQVKECHIKGGDGNQEYFIYGEQ